MTRQRMVLVYSFWERSLPASGLFRSSQRVTPSQAQIFLKFSKMPAERAIMPQAILWGNQV